MDKIIIKSVNYKANGSWNKQKVLKETLNLRNNLTEDGVKNLIHIII